MSAQQLLQHQVEAITVPSEDSIGNFSFQWSDSTTRSGAKGGTCSSVGGDTKTAPRGCFPILQFLKSSLLWRKASLPVDNKKLLADLKVHTNLIVDFFDEYLTPKLKLYAEQVHFPRRQSCYELGLYWLPTAQIWTATFILKLCALSTPCDSNNSTDSDSPNELENKEIVSSNSLRRLFILLFWEMENAKAAVQEYQTQMVKFVNELNSAFKKLRAILQRTSTRIKPFPSSQLQLASIKNSAGLYLNLKGNFEFKQKRDKCPMVLELNPNSHSQFQFSLSIDTKNKDGSVVTKNQDCSKVSSDVQEEIICGLLKFAVESIKNCECLLNSCTKRISSRGIIINNTGIGDKDVTCYSTLICIKAIVAELLSSKNAGNLDETEQNQLYGSIALLFEKWNEYVCCSQWVILKFYELCDMITLCYHFSLKHIKMNIPEMELIQKEVNVKSKFQKGNEKSRSRINNLKNYAIGSLIEECNAKGLIDDSGSSSSEMKGQPNYNFNQQSLVSTMYHLLIQECPLELLNGCGSYTIVLRPMPDLERVDPEMILKDGEYMIELKNRVECTTSSNIKEPDYSKLLKTFKRE